MENSSEIRDRMFNQVKEYIETYLYSIQTIRTLEVKAGKSGINRKFVENLRHGHDHFCQAMLSLVGTPPKLSGNQDNFSEAVHGMKNLSLDTCQWLAGETIKRAKDKIIYKSSEKNNFISIDKYDRATVSYNQGRDFRTTDMREANNRFIEAVELANEAVHSVELVSRSQRRTTLIAIVAIIISLLTFLAKFFGWFPTP